jgi:N6-L-threonylcarbamoyladenine synthase
MSVDEARYLAREVQRVAFEHLASRVVLVLQDMQKKQLEFPKTLVISGGVAANAFLRLVMESFLVVRGFESVQVVTPPVNLCTDNAAMIAWTGMEMFEAGFVNELDIRALRKWSLENVEYPEREADAKDVLTVLRDKERGQAEEMEFVAQG